ncbi:MAG: carbohydrate-binding protein, partial [Bacteroidota bacterium]
LDKPLYQYLPDSRITYDERHKLITARMVLSHSSGLENWQSNHNTDSLEILNMPGKKYNYSGEGYQYLAKVIQELLGQEYDEYIKDRVIKPLGLRNSYLRYKKKIHYPFRKSSPWNYVYGHGVFESRTPWLNSYSIPAAGNHFTAEDYAKLIIATFDSSYLSIKQRNELKSPVVKVMDEVYFGPGFEIIAAGNDTLIAQGGNKLGFKDWVFYSVLNNRGIVYMANSDRAELMTERLLELSVGFDISSWKKTWPGYLDQYPGTATELMTIYDKSGPDSMHAQFAKLKNQHEISSNTLNTLGDLFSKGGMDSIAENILKYNLATFPDSLASYYQLGLIYYLNGDYASALTYFTKKENLSTQYLDLDLLISICKEEVEKQRKRQAYLTTIHGSKESIIEAEKYNDARGIITGITADTSGNRNVGNFGEGDWLDYNIFVPESKKYTAILRVTSGLNGNKLNIFSGDKLLATVDIHSTTGWQNWTSIATSFSLPKGKQRLRLAIAQGTIGINWIKFSPPIETGD